MFVNLGDGNLFSLRVLAIRQAIAAKVNVTIQNSQANDAVAMTGGQPVDGTLSVAAMTRRVGGRGREQSGGGH